MSYVRRIDRMRVGRPSDYQGVPPQYNLPLEIGCFSLDSNSEFRDDDHQMMYLSMPTSLTGLHMDLNEGYEEYVHVDDETRDDFSAILRWILAHQEQVRNKFTDRFSASPKIDFICYRGLLTAVSSTIYEKQEDWLIYATRFRSIVYLSVERTERKAEEQKNATERYLRMTTWGFKFEQHMVSGAPHLKPVTSVPVNENEKYFTVIKGKLGNHRLLFAAEVDGVDPNHFASSGHDPTSVLRYTELKTSRVITSQRQESNFHRYKLIKWHLQSFFAGIPQVICGFRDDEGIVQELGVFNVRDMPKIAGGCWSKEACLKFCSQFLDNVKQWVIKDDPTVVYKIYWKPGSDIVCEELDSDYRILPNWYIDEVTVV